jgi:hypothetical protein
MSWPLFTPGKDPVPIVQEAGWAPGPVWTGAKNLIPTEIRSPDRPARNQSLYRLRYPAHLSTLNHSQTEVPNTHGRRSQWPRGLKHMSAAALLLRSWVRIPQGVWMSVYSECCVLQGRCLRRADHSSRGVLRNVVRHCV